VFSFANPGKKAMPREIFPGKNFIREGNAVFARNRITNGKFFPFLQTISEKQQ
jgi:hypothetical protein